MDPLEQLTAIQFDLATLSDNLSTKERQLFLLNKKEQLGKVFKKIASLVPEERQIVGGKAASLRKIIEEGIESLKTTTQPAFHNLADYTVPAFEIPGGAVHPISAMIEKMVGIFQDLSFEVVEGSEIVSEYDNFEALNIHQDHPARDSHESFFLNDELLLRTHTTAAQVLEMKKRLKNKELPIRVVVPGKCYRKEATDATHSLMFHHLDAVVVDTQTTFSDLKGSLDFFAKRLFGAQVETRFRPHHFPFTEPSAELDIRWKGNLSSEGKHAGWLEMGGCGMIHPKVLERAGLNPKIYQGWAFGMSVERPLMIAYQIPDIRLLYSNSQPFLSQFSDTI